jgi:hypothetical protein
MILPYHFTLQPFVAAFSARGATKEDIVEAARQDYRALLEKSMRSGVEAAEQERGA